MIDHVNIPVRDLNVAQPFYDATLGCLGLLLVAQDGPAIGYGKTHWVLGLEATKDAFTPLHLALSAESTAMVDRFYTSGIAAGGTCNGTPGLRAEYGEGYYACYLRDPDGHNIEAVFRGAIKP